MKLKYWMEFWKKVRPTIIEGEFLLTIEVSELSSSDEEESWLDFY